MSALLLCSDPTPSPTPCAQQFHVRASGWIDDSNMGGPAPEVAPSGIRLRWNLPFLSEDAALRGGFPLSFTVLRSTGMDGDALFVPEPTVGHLPRTVAPRNLWRDMEMARDAYFVVAQADECADASAVYFELRPDADPVEVTLLDLDGDIAATAYVGAKDRFYFEVARLRSVQFSARPQFVGRIQCLRFDDWSADLTPLATIDPRIWVTEALQDISVRIARKDGSRHLSISDEDWALLQDAGDKVISAHDTGDTLEGELMHLEMSAALKWEVAALMGWGFIDGEHPTGSPYDGIDDAAMMPAPSHKVFAYQVSAEFQDGSRALSRPYFVRADRLTALQAPDVRLVKPPVATFRSVNTIDIDEDAETPVKYPDPEAMGRRQSAQEEECFCEALYELANESAVVEKILTTPMATSSALTGEPFRGVESFVSNFSNARPIVADGLLLKETRQFSFEVPFVDSEIWLRVVAGDFWDRSSECPDTDRATMQLDYAGRSVPLERATCNSIVNTALLELQAEPVWKADTLATLLRGEIQFLGRRPDVTRLELPSRIGPITIETGSLWSTAIQSALDQAERDRLIGGTLEVGAYSFLIKQFRDVRGTLWCLFEAPAECGAISIPETQIDAVLREALESARLWKVIGETNLASDGTPQAMSYEADLNRFGDLDVLIPHSMTLHFATRLNVSYNGQTISGPVTTPVSAPYIASPPKPPEFCVNIRQLGKDYYGRSFVRVEADACAEFDERYSMRITCAPGVVTDDEEMQEKQADGLFRPHAPLLGKVAFEGFEMLSNASDGDRFTLALAYVRDEDDMEGEKKLFPFRAKENGG